jgi:hypothetical protein
MAALLFTESQRAGMSQQSKNRPPTEPLLICHELLEET